MADFYDNALAAGLRGDAAPGSGMVQRPHRFPGEGNRAPINALSGQPLVLSNPPQSAPVAQSPAPGSRSLPHSGSQSFYDQARQIDGTRLSPQDRAAAADRVSMLAGLLGTMARKPDLTRDKILQAGADAVKRGDVSAADVETFLSQAPKNPKALRDFVDRSFTDMLMASAHLSTARDQMGGR